MGSGRMLHVPATLAQGGPPHPCGGDPTLPGGLSDAAAGRGPGVFGSPPGGRRRTDAYRAPGRPGLGRRDTRSCFTLKNVEKHLTEPIVGSCLVTPKGAAAGAMARATLGAAGSM